MLDGKSTARSVGELPGNALQEAFAGLRYEPVVLLGQGGMADVLLAVSQGPGAFHKPVVIKMLRPELHEDLEMRRLFLEEARLCAQLNHANVVQVYDVIERGSTALLVMEYLEGPTLAELLRVAQRRLPVWLQLGVVCEVLGGLHYSHELTDLEGRCLNLVHRDVNPQNILITSGGEVKLLDFGIAKISSGDRTRTGIIKGKIRYMPPEQLAGGPIDRRADIYSVGCVLWELSVGRRMWGELPDQAVLRGIICGAIPRPREYAEIDGELESIIVRATAPDCVSRYATAAEFLHDLKHYMEGRYLSVSRQQIADFVLRLFGGEIERRNAQLASVVGSLDDFVGDAWPRLSVDWCEISESDSGAGGAAKSIRSLPRPCNPSLRRTGRGWITLAAALTLATTIGLGLYGTTGRLPLGGAAGSVSAKSSAARPETIRVTVRAEPEDANVSIDNQVFEGNPVIVQMAADQSPHVLLVSASGYLPVRRTVTLDHDLDLAVTLTQRAPSGTPSSPTSTAPGRKRPQASPRLPSRPPAVARPPPTGMIPPAVPNPNCVPPYRLEHGVKTYKPECL